MTTGLFLLRCFQKGITTADLENLTVGTIYDIFTESANDDYDYATLATQEDIDKW